MAWEMRYALGGGFGGVENEEWTPCAGAKNEDDALRCAFECACELYENYEGMHGLRSVNDIMEDEDCDESEAISIYEEEREMWLDYDVREVNPTNQPTGE